LGDASFDFCLLFTTLKWATGIRCFISSAFESVQICSPAKLSLFSAWIKALGRSALSCVWPIRTGYDFLRIILAFILLVAAVLKAYELATGPVLGNSLFDSRRLLFVEVEFEFFFALWLFSGFYPKQTWVATFSALFYSRAFCPINLFRVTTVMAVLIELLIL
jgi:hypothetical protein